MPLTPEEIAEAEALEAQAPTAAAPFDPLTELSAEDLADLAVKDKTFLIAEEFKKRRDLYADQPAVQKAADALNLVKQRGFSLEDLPTVGEAAGAVGTAVKGLAGQIWNYASAGVGMAQSGLASLVGNEELSSAFGEDVSRRLASNIAGTEEAVTGLSQLAEKGARKAGQALGIAKEFKDYSPAERVTDLFDDVGRAEVREERLSGKGEFTKTVTGGEQDLDPEEVATLAAGDPVSLYLFGAGSGAAAKAVKAVTPASVRGAVTAATEAVGQAAEKAVPAVVGGTITGGARAASGAAKVVEKTAPTVVAVIGAAKAGTFAGPAGVLGGLYAGRQVGKGLARGAKRAQPTIARVAEFGREVAGSVPVKSAYAQGVKDVLQSLPGAAGEVAKGTALDIGLAAVTAELPQDTQGAVGFGTVIGAGIGGARVAGRVLSGQLIAPREYGTKNVVPSSGQFPVLDTMHADAFKAATPGVRARLNAVRQFVGEAAPGTDVFLARDAAAIEQALTSAGFPPETAKLWSQQSGFLTVSIPSKSGNPRRVAIVRDVDAAPHEAFHAVQDVLGEEANRKVDQIIREAYADSWEAEGQSYSTRLTGDGANWRESVLDASGWGLLEAKEKIFRDIYNRIEGETGSTPSPALVEQLAKAELGTVMDAAVQANPGADPNLIARHVWRNVLTPFEITEVSDRYIAREIAAENFDAVLKNQGPRLEEGKQLPQRLARILGSVVSLFGGEPLTGRTSEFGNVPLRTDAVKAVRDAARGQLKPGEPAAPKVEPRGSAGPRPTPGTPGTPEAAEANAKDAQALADAAPDAPLPGGTRSPKELLGEIAAAMATQSGVKINYLSAPGEPAAAISSNRAARRAIIETFRTMPPEARALWEKTFFPDRVTQTKNGNYQVQGWAPEVFAANAHKLAEFLNVVPDAQALVPYAIDPATKSFTPDAWRELFADTQDFVQNQGSGATGAGEPLVVPRSVTDAGGFAPATRKGAVPLDQTKADFINLLFNFKLPETPRIQSGKRPLNIIGQEVSEATKPGRVEVPVRPRGEFVGDEATRQGIAGREVLEVNPLRNQLEAAAQQAGKPMPSMIEVIQKLNLENIKEVQVAPEQPQFRGNTLTLTAGFQPEKRSWRVKGRVRGEKTEVTVDAVDIAEARKLAEDQGMSVANVENADKFSNALFQPESGERSWKVTGRVRGEKTEVTVRAADIADARKQAEAQGMSVANVENADKFENAMFQARTDRGRTTEERGFEIRHTGGPNRPGIEIFKDGRDVGYIQAERKSPTEADIGSIKVDKAFRGQGLSEILYREIGKRLQEEGVENVTGMIINPKALTSRTKVFPNTKVDLAEFPGGEISAFVNSPISRASQFNPAELANRVEKFSPEEFRAWVKSIPDNNFTGEAHALGRSADTQAFADSLKSRYEKLAPGVREAMKDGRFDDASVIASQAQFFREAYEAATGSGGSADFLRKSDPDYQPPFPIRTDSPAAQAQPKPSEEVRKIASDYAKARGLRSSEGSYVPAPEPLLRELADFYEAAESSPTDSAVVASYGALKQETLEQYQAMVDAGIVVEPWTEPGQPYADSAAMVADVNDNKHLFYFKSEEGYGNRGDAAQQNLMLEDSGVVINGESVPFNDLFRAVHDFFGHAKEGYQFGPRGEFNAWGTHSEMFSKAAQGALAAETLAQNSFVNFGPHMRSESGATLKKGEPGYLEPADRPFAEQKAIVIPQELIDQARAQFVGKKKKADPNEFKPGSGGFSKAWILPSGEVAQLGGTWHHQWLSENPKVAERYGLTVPKFDGTDTEGVREDALKKGFVRVNYSTNTGALTVEARAKDWRRVKPAVERLAEANIGNLDRMTVHLLDEKAAKVVDSAEAKLFTYDDAEKMQHLPFITEGDVRGQFQPDAELPLLNEARQSQRQAQRLLRAQVADAKEKYPEALPLEFRKTEDGAYRFDANGDPTEVAIPYGLSETPLAKTAIKGKRGDDKKKAAVARAYADAIKREYDSVKENPDIVAGANWYSLAREKLSGLFGADTKFFTELLGATSAQTDVPTNFRYSIEAYNKFKAGDYDAQIAKYREGKQIWEQGGENLRTALGELELPEDVTRPAFFKKWIDTHDLKPAKGNGKLFGANSVAVLKVLDGSWREEVQGPKTPNFAGNLSGDSFEATIDIWSARLLHRLGNQGNEKRWRILPKNETGVTDPDFFLGQSAFRLAGDELGISPDSLQAILWFAEKDVWSKRGWTKTAGAAKADFNVLLEVTRRDPATGRLSVDAVRRRDEPKRDKAQLDFELPTE